FSSGDCTDRNNPHCTSLDQIHEATIDGVIQTQIEAGCPSIDITGGTEVGHDPGTYSHGSGWKVDLRGMPCLDNYIPSVYTQYVPNNYCNYHGFLNCSQYYYEISHWDWNFGIGPGCGC
uniref:Uncharacterized protein n=1 Tax=Plectus sambesii TaxID=2011161 RepID=A0A914UZV6_9BILA